MSTIIFPTLEATYMMRSNRILLFLFFLLGLLEVGCGPSELPYTDNSKDTEAFAKTIKGLVLNTAERIKDSAQPADSLRQVVLSLSELKDCPTGDHLAKYEEMHKLLSELLKDSEKGKPSNFKERLAKVSELAKQLPGEVVVDKAGKD